MDGASKIEFSAIFSSRKKVVSRAEAGSVGLPPLRHVAAHPHGHDLVNTLFPTLGTVL